MYKDEAVLHITVLHNLGVVWKMCDTVMVMYAGKTVEYADAKTMRMVIWYAADANQKLNPEE